MRTRPALLGLTLAIAVTTTMPRASAADPSSFEVMGLRLGMNASEAEAAGEENGFDIVGRDLAPSFKQAVAQRRGQRIKGNTYTGVNKIRLVRDDARVEAFFAPTPDGPRLYQVAVDILKLDENDDLRKGIIAKYGEPDERGEREWLWGDANMFYARTNPYLEFQPEPVTATRPRPIGRLILGDPSLKKRSQDAVSDKASKD